MNKFGETLLDVLKTISKEFKLNLIKGNVPELNLGAINPLFSVKNNGIQYSDNQVIKYMSDCKSKLTDAFVDFDNLKGFCEAVSKQSSKVILNHIGLCYQVPSKALERKRLSGVAIKNRLHLYEMRSNDCSLWLFMGDKSNLQDPLVECLPVEKVNDYYLDYWLPHFHLALHTNLSVENIKYMTHTLFKGTRSANLSVVVNGITYQSRIWLGTIDGVNITLDLLTNEPENSLTKTRQYLKTLI